MTPTHLTYLLPVPIVGAVADRAKSALVVVDMLNAYRHDDAEPLTESVETIIEPVPL